jgi:hypothetical protein
LKRQNLKAHKLILANERRMSVGELNALLPRSSAPAAPPNSKVVRLFKSTIQAPPETSADYDDEQPDQIDLNLARFDALKARPPESLNEDDRIWLAIYDAGPELRAMRRIGYVK